MANDQGPVVQSALLRGELIRLRKGRGMTQEQVATELEWSPSKLIRVEGGRSAVTKVDLDALISLYGVTSEIDRERLQALNRGARNRAWWDDYRDDILSPIYVRYVGYEAGAKTIRQFIPTVVPGMLQTAEYAEALTAISLSPAKVAPVVNLRLARQRALKQRYDPPHQIYILDEAAIRRRIGIHRNPAIMPSQLQHLMRISQEDGNVTIRVIPFAAGEYLGLTDPFTLLEFEGDLPDVLYRDTGQETIVMVTDNSEAARYADTFESLQETALSSEDSAGLIRSIVEEIY